MQQLMEQIIHSPYLYIGLELAAIVILLIFVKRWSAERKQWKIDQEKSRAQAKEDEMLKILANDRRTQ